MIDAKINQLVDQLNEARDKIAELENAKDSDKPKSLSGWQTLKKYLAECKGIEVRYNTRFQRIEWRNVPESKHFRHTSPWMNPWYECDNQWLLAMIADLDDDKLNPQIRKSIDLSPINTNTDRAFGQLLGRLASKNLQDGIKVKLVEAYEVYKGRTDKGQERIADMVKHLGYYIADVPKDDYKIQNLEILNFNFRYLIGSLVELSFNPGSTWLDYLPVFISHQQGTGKTSILRFMATKFDPDLYTPLGAFHRDPKITRETFEGVWLGELQEGNTISEANLNNIEKQITSFSMRTRLPYAISPTQFKRTWQYVATTNETQCIPAKWHNQRRFSVATIARFKPKIEGLRVSGDWRRLLDKHWIAMIGYAVDCYHADHDQFIQEFLRMDDDLDKMRLQLVRNAETDGGIVEDLVMEFLNYAKKYKRNGDIVSFKLSDIREYYLNGSDDRQPSLESSRLIERNQKQVRDLLKINGCDYAQRRWPDSMDSPERRWYQVFNAI